MIGNPPQKAAGEAEAGKGVLIRRDREAGERGRAMSHGPKCGACLRSDCSELLSAGEASPTAAECGAGRG